MRLLCLSFQIMHRPELLAAIKAAGFIVDHVPGFDLADEAISGSPYSAAIVSDTGRLFAAAQWVRRQRREGLLIPILLQTEQDSADCRIAAFEAGVDDCFRLPIVPRELIARLRAVLRRPPLVQQTALKAGNARLDPETREVWVSDRRIKVPRREVSLLEQLMRRYTRVVPRMQLEANLYGVDDDVAPNSIEVGVSRIRRRLQDAGATVEIQTVRGVGYCLGPQEGRGAEGK